jgi:N-methylhydantoinase A
LSALGLAISDERRDFSAPLLSGLDELDPARLHEAFETLEASRGEALESPELTRRADLRYRRQAFELTVPAADADTLAEAFPRGPRAPIRLRDERGARRARRDQARGHRGGREAGALEPESQGDSVVARREVNLGEDWDVHRRPRAREDGRRQRGGRAGPRGVRRGHLPRAPGWSGKVDEAGTLVLERR